MSLMPLRPLLFPDVPAASAAPAVPDALLPLLFPDVPDASAAPVIP